MKTNKILKVENKRLTWIIYFVLLAGTLFSCGKQQENKVADENTNEEESLIELTKPQYENAKIELGSIEKKNLSDIVNAKGVLDVPPQNLISINAPLGGFVKKTELLEGDKVRKGQVIAVLQHPDFIQMQQEYLQSVSKLRYLEKEYARQKELNEENVSAAKVFQQAESDFQIAVANVKALEAKLALIGINKSAVLKGNITSEVNIYSPINGFVGTINVNIGKYVQPQDVMFQIVDTEHLHVELTIFEKDIPKIRENQKVRYKIPNESGRERIATVYLIGRIISESRSVRVHCHMEEEDKSLLPGMYVDATIEVTNNAVNALPNEAIVKSENKEYVFVVVEGKHNGVHKGENENEKVEKELQNEEIMHFEMVEVLTGISDLGYTQIKNPEAFEQASKIVTKGTFFLLSKLKGGEEGGHGH